jgi:hypothetical protein
MLAERAFAVCAQAHHACPLELHNTPIRKASADRRAPCGTPRVSEGIAELPISDPAQLAVVVVVDGAGIDAPRWWTVCMCGGSRLSCCAASACAAFCLVAVAPGRRWWYLGRGVALLHLLLPLLLVILCEGPVCLVVPRHVAASASHLPHRCSLLPPLRPGRPSVPGAATVRRTLMSSVVPYPVPRAAACLIAPVSPRGGACDQRWWCTALRI